MENTSLDNKIDEAVVVSPEASPEAPAESTPEQKAAEAGLSEVLMASKTFEQLNTIFSNVLERYEGSKSQIVRAWRNAALAPLNQAPLHFSYPEEKQIFDLYTEMNSLKLVLMVHGLADAGVLTLHKPLMQAVPKTASEVELNKMMGDVERQAQEIAQIDASRAAEVTGTENPVGV